MEDAALEIDICICSFRRPHVAETLRSIARLNIKPKWFIRVIVADNDDTPSARDLVERTDRECWFTVNYLHAPARNISVARNACLDAATAPLVAFIDDDELASPQWLTALVATLERAGADVVLGPVQGVYRPDCPSWMAKGDFHSIKAGVGRRSDHNRLHLERPVSTAGGSGEGSPVLPRSRPGW